MPLLSSAVVRALIPSLRRVIVLAGYNGILRVGWSDQIIVGRRVEASVVMEEGEGGERGRGGE